MAETEYAELIAQLRRGADTIERSMAENIDGLCYTPAQSKGQIIDLRRTADALSSLLAENARLKEALEQISKLPECTFLEATHACSSSVIIARAALHGDPHLVQDEEKSCAIGS